MDVVGSASGTITLVDLAKKLYDFWEAIEDAPGEIREITENIITLKTIIERVADAYNRSLARVSSVEEVLRKSETKIKELLGFLEELEIGSLRVWQRHGQQ
jgi:DNA repair ATPase RecN